MGDIDRCGPSFLSAFGEGSRGAFLIDFVFFAVVGFVGAKNHSGLARSLRVVVPDGLICIGDFLLLSGVFKGLFCLPPCFLIAETDATLIVVEVES